MKTGNTLSPRSPQVETLNDDPTRREIRYNDGTRSTYNAIYEKQGVSLSIGTEAMRNGYATGVPYAYSFGDSRGHVHHILPGRGLHGLGVVVTDIEPQSGDPNRKMKIRRIREELSDIVTIGGDVHLPIGREGAYEDITVTGLAMFKHESQQFNSSVSPDNRGTSSTANPLALAEHKASLHEQVLRNVSNAAGSNAVSGAAR